MNSLLTIKICNFETMLKTNESIYLWPILGFYISLVFFLQFF